MKSNPPDWYSHAWSLDVKQQSWVEQTEQQVDFLKRRAGCVWKRLSPLMMANPLTIGSCSCW
ncbi:MAG TPA: hypothetical protein PKN45_00685 [Candidatus Limiplasma sp.]|nr:hypothetical protein [Candidatus Limiplasma sp.]HPR77521.1 hypothetical protein [Candidatus Limiplasma sp.]